MLSRALLACVRVRVCVVRASVLLCFACLLVFTGLACCLCAPGLLLVLFTWSPACVLFILYSLFVDSIKLFVEYIKVFV